MNNILLVIGFTLFWALHAPASAQRLGSSVRIVAENDEFNFWRNEHQRPDENYTHGLKVAWQIAREALNNA